MTTQNHLVTTPLVTRFLALQSHFSGYVTTVTTFCEIPYMRERYVPLVFRRVVYMPVYNRWYIFSGYTGYRAFEVRFLALLSHSSVTTGMLTDRFEWLQMH